MYQYKNILILVIFFLGISILAANQVPRETIVAEFSGGKIIYGDIEDRISKIPPMYQTKYKTEDGMNSLLEMMCTEEVFYLEALDRNLSETENFEEHSNMQIKSFLKNEFIKDLLKENIILTDEEKQAYFREHAEDSYAGRIYDEAVADVENRLRSQKEQTFMEEYYTGLIEKYNIVVNESILQQIDLQKE